MNVSMGMVYPEVVIAILSDTRLRCGDVYVRRERVTEGNSAWVSMGLQYRGQKLMVPVAHVVKDGDPSGATEQST